MSLVDRLRAFANLPVEVPQALLSEHVALAERELRGRVNQTSSPPGLEPVWEEAILVRALSSALPWLNTFALDGAAKVGRLEGTVEFRFLTPDDVTAREKRLLQRFEQLVATLTAAAGQGVGAATFILDAI